MLSLLADGEHSPSVGHHKIITGRLRAPALLEGTKQRESPGRPPQPAGLREPRISACKPGPASIPATDPGAGRREKQGQPDILQHSRGARLFTLKWKVSSRGRPFIWVNLGAVSQLKLIICTHGHRTPVQGGKQRVEEKGWANRS